MHKITAPPAPGDVVYLSENGNPWDVTGYEPSSGLVSLWSRGAALPSAQHWTELYYLCDCTIAPGEVTRELNYGTTLRDMADVLEAGPIWTNGSAPAAAVLCPAWCTKHEQDPFGNAHPNSAPHEHELASFTVLDEELTTDVPLRVLLRQDADMDTGGHVCLEIGHALYQPTGVVMSRSDAARLAAALITGNVMLVQDR